ncbi:SPOR domain-containing protein [Pseudohalocynthiibacter aestuariivivens]|uniref:SPOR domain-containing protein n=1 Tax=Pseudohalocynthiibacter aestuariivivens TaxID=1591409 RepID=A0ABV5JCT4_9RHOB|nr:SPOR domain-containing protein [Pseudohalocynthiibacter aestuariivivens]MBS9717242.1 SPOR domain-containing protein [Pseudohalocynthiibacter aestuariivivens]
MGNSTLGQLATALALTVVLAGCEEGAGFNPFKPAAQSDEESSSPSSTRLVERDVEAPEVFQVTENGLWDGRPSLGGVWVAHPDVTDPERVIIRNETNDKFVIGALFRRERESLGPRLQVSSDAAEALGMLAGQPARMNVTALRREEVTPEVPEEAPSEAGLENPEAIEEIEIDPIASATAALDAVESEAGSEAAPATTAPASAPARAASTLEKPFIQIGIFSVEENANSTATSMRLAGMVPIVTQHDSSGKIFWRVVVGPATSVSERAALLSKIKELGFEDAYFVTN